MPFEVARATVAPIARRLAYLRETRLAMFVELEVLSGPDKGRIVTIKTGESLEIGRTSSEGLAVPSDRFMSGRHCVLTCEPDILKIRDLNSQNGTFLNDQPVLAESVIRDGDRLRAARTVFEVRLRDSATNEQHFLGMTDNVIVRPPQTQAIIQGMFTRGKAPSGLIHFRSHGESTVNPAQISHSLDQSCPMYVVVDTKRLGMTLPPNAELEYLYSDLPPEARKAVSPVIACPGDPVNRFKLVADGWTKDALVCFFSTAPKEKVLGHLRELARGKEYDQIEPRGDQAAGIYLPSVVTQLLFTRPPAVAQFLMRDLEAVFLEGSPPLPNAWQAFSGSTFRHALEGLGLTLVDTAPAANA